MEWVLEWHAWQPRYTLLLISSSRGYFRHWNGRHKTIPYVKRSLAGDQICRIEIVYRGCQVVNFDLPQWFSVNLVAFMTSACYALVFLSQPNPPCRRIACVPRVSVCVCLRPAGLSFGAWHGVAGCPHRRRTCHRRVDTTRGLPTWVLSMASELTVQKAPVLAAIATVAADPACPSTSSRRCFR